MGDRYLDFEPRTDVAEPFGKIACREATTARKASGRDVNCRIVGVRRHLVPGGFIESPEAL